MNNYRISKNGKEKFVIDSNDAEYLSVSFAQSKSLPTSVFSSEAVRALDDGRKMLVKWPEIEFDIGDKN